MFRESGLYAQLEDLVGEHSFVLYGDPAYPLRDLLMKPYSTSRTTPEQVAFNYAMSSVRQAVEWGFGKLVGNFAFLDFKKNQKMLLQDLRSMYRAAVILINCHTCLYGSQTGTQFNVQPPTLEEYLAM